MKRINPRRERDATMLIYVRAAMVDNHLADFYDADWPAVRRELGKLEQRLLRSIERLDARWRGGRQ